MGEPVYAIGWLRILVDVDRVHGALIVSIGHLPVTPRIALRNRRSDVPRRLERNHGRSG